MPCPSFALRIGQTISFYFELKPYVFVMTIDSITQGFLSNQCFMVRTQELFTIFYVAHTDRKKSIFF